jgi:hypothetical protein
VNRGSSDAIVTHPFSYPRRDGFPSLSLFITLYYNAFISQVEVLIMYTEITATIQSVKALYSLVKATHGLSNSTEVLAAVNEIQQKLMDANGAALASQEKQASLAQRVRELETQLREAEDWNTQMQRYQLVEFPDTKTLALKLRADMANGEPIHYLCRACADKKQKTTLQPLNRHLHCPESRYHVTEVEALPPALPSAQMDRGEQSWMR